MSLYVITAYCAKTWVIGADGVIPWSIPKDLQFFKHATMGGTVLMGRATYESIPKAHRNLPGRECVVLSKSRDVFPPDVSICRSEQ